MSQIKLKLAHDALEKLLADLDTVDVGSLPDKTGTRQLTAEAWVAALQDARAGLFEWCENQADGANQFMTEIKSKR